MLSNGFFKQILAHKPRERQISDVSLKDNEDSIVSFEQGASQMTLQEMRPIPKPSIGEQESFIEPFAETFNRGSKFLTAKGRKKQRYADTDLLRESHKDDFEHLTVDCLNETPPSQSEDDIIHS